MRKRDGKTLQKNERRRIEEKDSFGEAKEHTENIQRIYRQRRIDSRRNIVWRNIDGKCILRRERERDIYMYKERGENE